MGQYFVYKVEKLSKKQHSLAVSFGGGGFRENGDHPNEGTRTIKQTLAFDTNHRQRTSLEQEIRTKISSRVRISSAIFRVPRRSALKLFFLDLKF
jgi:hypothetical protein